MLCPLFAPLLLSLTASSVSAGFQPGYTALNPTSDFPAPQFNLSFIAYLEFDVQNTHAVKNPEGYSLNIAITGGNWTTPSGELLATVIPNIGGEIGTIDPTGQLHVYARYAVQFADDNSTATVIDKGKGTQKTYTQSLSTIVTSSEKHGDLSRQVFYVPGKFYGNLLIGPHWTPTVPAFIP